MGSDSKDLKAVVSGKRNVLQNVKEEQGASKRHAPDRGGGEMQRPLYDLSLPPERELHLALLEHLKWDRMDVQTKIELEASFSCDGDGTTLPAAVAHSALDYLQTSYHLCQTTISYSRCGGFMMGHGNEVAIIGGRVMQDVEFQRKEYNAGTQKGQPKVNMATIQNGAGYKVLSGKARQKAKQSDREKQSDQEKEESWALKVGQTEDQSQMGTYSKPVLCDSNLHLLNAGLSVRRANERSDRYIPAPRRSSLVNCTAATFDGFTVVYGHQAVLEIHHLRPPEVDAKSLTLSVCGADENPELDNLTSSYWRADDIKNQSLIRPTANILSGSVLTCRAALMEFDKGTSPPSGNAQSTKLVGDEAGCRLLLLTTQYGGSSWKLMAIVPRALAGKNTHIVTLTDALTHSDRFQALPRMECTGRPISDKYSILHAHVHQGNLFALVCPDATTLKGQKPCVLRVYRLKLDSLIWELLSPSRHGHSGPDPHAYPIPRQDAACAVHGRKMYVHGGMAAASGHGCLSDIWTFDMQYHAWHRIIPSSDQPKRLAKLALHKPVLMSACQHCCAVLEGGKVIIFGGVDARGHARNTLQLITPLITALPGGVPSQVCPTVQIRAAGCLAGLMQCRALIARGVIAVHPEMALVETRSSSGLHRLKVAIAVFALYSSVVDDMMMDGVMESAECNPDLPSGGASDLLLPKLPANPRDDVHAVRIALRWVMGLTTCLTLNAEELVAVLRVADHFRMRALRVEALAILCGKSTIADLPILMELADVNRVQELNPCIKQLREEANRQQIAKDLNVYRA